MKNGGKDMSKVRKESHTKTSLVAERTCLVLLSLRNRGEVRKWVADI